MKQLTAIEWLIDQIDNKDMGEIPMWIYDFCYDALEMEKQQIIDAFDEGKWNGYENAKGASDFKDPLIYYKETFESQNP